MTPDGGWNFLFFGPNLTAGERAEAAVSDAWSGFGKKAFLITVGVGLLGLAAFHGGYPPIARFRARSRS